MEANEFAEFRLVGGTALSLQKGHRQSVDIDLFTDAQYGSIDFDAIDIFLHSTYSYVDNNALEIIGMGTSYFVGENEINCIKLDIYYTDPFIQPVLLVDRIRMATVEEIIAMKIDVISRSGRKKDFWDLHELIENYPINKMLSLHSERYPFTHNKKDILKKFTDFTNADGDFNPICLREKYWELIKLDLINFTENAY